jgi:uncharacterized protein (DUF58 family)
MTVRLFNVKRFFSAPPVSPPFELGRKQIYILPTGHGLVFMTVLVGMLLGSANYNNNLGFLLTFLLGSMGFVSIFHTYRNLAGLEILSVVSRPVFAGETAVFDFRVTTGRFERSGVIFRIADGPDSGHILPKKQEIRIDASAPAPARGVLRPRPLVISTCHPLGLFRAWARLSPPLKTIVYPRPIEGPMTSRRHHHAGIGGAGRSESPGTDDFGGLKAYQPGDPLRHISWKAFSKGQGLLTKSFCAETGQTVALDWQQLSGDDEKRLSRLCAMVLSAERLGLRYGLTLPGKTLEPDRGDAYKHRCLQALALFGTEAFKTGISS